MLIMLELHDHLNIFYASWPFKIISLISSWVNQTGGGGGGVCVCGGGGGGGEAEDLIEKHYLKA